MLYWVGCAASFDERARVTAQSTAKLLQAAGVDFAILGPRESCTGDPARRMGNEYTYQAYAEQNVATLNESGVTKIVASCPHCFNTIANEYPDFGGRYEVVHHTELLTELLEEGRLQPAAGSEEITYHDSCYLARHNDVLAAPREIVSRIGKPLEMARSGKRGVLLRRRRRPHVARGARQPDQPGAGARGGRDGRLDAGRGLSLLHGDAGRRRAAERRRDPGRRRGDAARRGPARRRPTPELGALFWPSGRR